MHCDASETTVIMIVVGMILGYITTMHVPRHPTQSLRGVRGAAHTTATRQRQATTTGRRRHHSKSCTVTHSQMSKPPPMPHVLPTFVYCDVRIPTRRHVGPITLPLHNKHEEHNHRA
jgi:hypothetical protein